MIHALTCPIRRHWLRWRWHMPFWRDDRVAKMLGVAHLGCPRCGRGATEADATREAYDKGHAMKAHGRVAHHSGTCWCRAERGPMDRRWVAEHDAECATCRDADHRDDATEGE